MTEVRRAIRFFESIDLLTREAPHGVVPDDGSVGRPFVEGVWVDHGVLVYHPSTLRFPHDLYHEAGHLAVVPSPFRPVIATAMDFDKPSDEFRGALDAYIAAHPDGMCTHPEDPVYRGILQMGEAEAIAWSFAAMIAAGCDLDDYWREEPTLFGGEAPEIAMMLEGRAHVGINGLQAAGMTTVRSYPVMTRWLQV